MANQKFTQFETIDAPIRLETILAKSRRQIESGRGIPHDEFWARLTPPRPAKRKQPRPAAKEAAR